MPTGALAESLRASGHHPVRFWNFVPGIHADMGGGLDRYMVFNAGRYAAFEEWFGQAALFTRTVPTASAVGIGSGALAIHALGGRDAGLPVENPRQVPAYRYSARYGPIPPCFARGTIVRGLPARPDEGGDGPVLLVGGTASIVGEDSLHDRDARQQALETFENLAELVAAARRQIGGARRREPRRAAGGLRRLHRAARLHRPRQRRAAAARDGHRAVRPHGADRIRAGRSLPARAARRNRRPRHALARRASASVTAPAPTTRPSAVTSPSIL